MHLIVVPEKQKKAEAVSDGIIPENFPELFLKSQFKKRREINHT